MKLFYFTSLAFLLCFLNFSSAQNAEDILTDFDAAVKAEKDQCVEMEAAFIPDIQARLKKYLLQYAVFEKQTFDRVLKISAGLTDLPKRRLRLANFTDLLEVLFSTEALQDMFDLNINSIVLNVTSIYQNGLEHLIASEHTAAKKISCWNTFKPALLFNEILLSNSWYDYHFGLFERALGVTEVNIVEYMKLLNAKIAACNKKWKCLEPFVSFEYFHFHIFYVFNSLQFFGANKIRGPVPSNRNVVEISYENLFGGLRSEATLKFSNLQASSSALFDQVATCLSG